MRNIQRALIWAAIIIIAAFYMEMQGMDKGTSLGVIGGLSIFALRSSKGCGWSPLQ